MPNAISGFSKFTKSEKIEWLLDTYFNDKDAARTLVTQYWNTNEKLQKLHDEFIENTVSNFYLPFLYIHLTSSHSTLCFNSSPQKYQLIAYLTTRIL